MIDIQQFICLVFFEKENIKMKEFSKDNHTQKKEERKKKIIYLTINEMTYPDHNID